MTTPPAEWDVTKSRRVGQVPNFSGPDVMNELVSTQQAPEFIWLHAAHPSNSKWDCTFGLAFRVQLDGWTVYVVSHIHVKKIISGAHKGTFQYGDGHSYIPGYANFDAVTPEYAFLHVPGYDKTIHVNKWTDNAPAKNAFLAGGRYPG